MKKISSSRRSFLRQSTIVTTGLITAPTILSGLYAAPGNPIKGVTLGVITYSFREQPDQSIEAILQSILDTGLRATELMGDTAEIYAGKPKNPVKMSELFSLWRTRSEGTLTDDQKKQLESLEAQNTEYRKETSKWRASASLKPFEKIKAMFDKAGVRIYAFKPDAFGKDNSEAESTFAFKAGKILGATHCTVEHPSNDVQTLKLGTLALQNGMKIAYHGHEQQTFTLWNTAVSQSKGNMINIDLGHYVAAGNADGLKFMADKHDRIASMHLKDRQSKEHGKANLEWGKGDTPIIGALQLMRDKKYTFPGTIELEYKIPDGSTAVQEVKKCYEYAKKALMS